MYKYSGVESGERREKEKGQIEEGRDGWWSRSALLKYFKWRVHAAVRETPTCWALLTCGLPVRE